jgi:hypothetical protein
LLAADEGGLLVLVLAMELDPEGAEER